MLSRAINPIGKTHLSLHAAVTMRGKGTAAQPAIPRPSASLVVVNKNNEVLLVHRNPKSTAFAGAHVSSIMYKFCIEPESF
jgi:hypothetical protein